MRPSVGRPARRGAAWHRQRASWLVLGVVISVWCCLALAGGRAPAQSYSAYSDPEKPAISFIFSQESNVEEFQGEFGLDDEAMGQVLAAVQKESETLAQAYAESERREITTSEYNERVREAVAQTKSSIEVLLAEDQVPHLAEWVDAKFAHEGQEAEAASVAGAEFSASGSRSLRCKVYATYFKAYTRYQVALPHTKPKREGFKVGVRPATRHGRGVKAPVKDVGPWNTNDDYWQGRGNREWKNLPRCVPEAQAAYFDNYHRGKDEFGRTVRNPAGIDLSPGVAKRMRIWDRMKRQGVVRLYVRYPWVKR